MPPSLPDNPESNAPDIDRVYAEAKEAISPFVFNHQVAQVFDDMIARSVPGYALCHEVLALITNRYAQPGSVLFDLGCSSGTSTNVLANSSPTNCKVIGIDNSQPMIDRCQVTLHDLIENDRITLRCQDIGDTDLTGASIIVLNYTLQFLPLAIRDQLMTRIYQSLLPGGIVFIAEKVLNPEHAQQQAINDLHLDFKRQQGYSELEIAQKRSALEAVLIPETETAHHQRLTQCGFEIPQTLTRALNFIAFMGQKPRSNSKPASYQSGLGSR
jgi:tRNA (cmo5U34)-methyltransferase